MKLAITHLTIYLIIFTQQHIPPLSFVIFSFGINAISTNMHVFLYLLKGYLYFLFTFRVYLSKLVLSNCSCLYGNSMGFSLLECSMGQAP